MDRRTRRLQRKWYETNDTYTHAELLQHLLTYGLLDEKRVLCAGYFGHEASRLALPGKIKKHKVITEKRVLKTEELNDFISGIFYWPRDIYLRATLAAARLAEQHIVAPQVIADIKLMNNRLEEYIINRSPDELEAIHVAARRRHSWWTYTIALSFNNRQRRLQEAVGSLYRRHIATGNIQALMSIGAQFKDKIFRNAIGEGTIPYLLGEWK